MIGVVKWDTRSFTAITIAHMSHCMIRVAKFRV